MGQVCVSYWLKLILDPRGLAILTVKDNSILLGGNHLNSTPKYCELSLNAWYMKDDIYIIKLQKLPSKGRWKDTHTHTHTSVLCVRVCDFPIITQYLDKI